MKIKTMRYLGGIALTALVTLFASCDETITNTTGSGPRMDTLSVINNWFLDENTTVRATDFGAETFAPVNLFNADGELFAANPEGKTVEVFDAVDMRHLRTLRHADRGTEAWAVCADGDYVYAACGSMREVQLFNRKTGDYVTRLNSAWVASVAVSDKYVFIRDSKDYNIPVFAKSDINPLKADNGTVFARLTTDDTFIGSKTEPQNNSYSITVMGDSLYAFMYTRRQIYAYSLADVETLKNLTQPLRTTLAEGVTVYSAAPAADGKTIWLSMKLDGVKAMAQFNLDDFANRNFSRPLRAFKAHNRHPFDGTPMMTIQGETPIYTSPDGLERWTIGNHPSYVMAPSKSR